MITDRLVVDLIIAVVFLLIASGLYFIGRFSKKLFNQWGTKDKQLYVKISIFAVIVLAIINSYSPKIIANIALAFSIGLVAFIILLASSISTDKKE